MYSEYSAPHETPKESHVEKDRKKKARPQSYKKGELNGRNRGHPSGYPFPIERVMVRMKIKEFLVLATGALVTVGFFLKQNVDIQNKAIKELQAIQSAEEKAEQRVLTQCHVDVLRECETPRFVPPPFLFVGEDVPSPFADAFLGTSFRHPLAEVRQSSFLIISSSEPSMGLDRDDRQEQTQELQLFASSAPQQQDPVMQMARRRLSEATSQIPRGVPSHCLHTAFTEQRVSLRCAGALHHLQSVSTQKAESMIDLYRESTGDMQSLIAIYSLVCFCMLLVILGRRTRRKLSHRRRGPLLPCCTKLVIAVAYLLTTLSLALAISPVLMVLLVMVPVAALQFYFFHTCHDHCDSAYEQTRDSSESVCRSIDEVSSKLAVGNELVIYEGVPIQVV